MGMHNDAAHDHMAPQDVEDHLASHHNLDGIYASLSDLGVQTGERYLINWALGYLMGAGIDVTWRDLSDDEIVDIALHEYAHREHDGSGS